MDIRETFEKLDKQFTSYGGLEPRGITRLLYSEEWREAVSALQDIFKENGLEVSNDAVGNVSGRLIGSELPDETIMSGSHIDTVAEGGHLDGQFGILSALIATLYLKEKYGQPKRTLEVLSIAEEEGSRFPYTFWGVKNFFNLQNNDDVKDIVDGEGIKFVDAMKESGFDFKTDDKVRDDIKAFVEVHIEQGQILEKEEKQIGVVTGIVGQKRYTINLKGEANHAGTTPMGYRKDAVVAFTEIAQTLVQKAREIGDPLVVTFGSVKPVPGVVNVVPGEVEFSIDTRHIDETELNSFAETVEATINEVSDKYGITADINLWMEQSPALMDDSIVKMIEESAEKVAGGSYKVMPSGAGHDSQIFAGYMPTGMIFVPSIGGISHNVEEETDVEDLVKGIEVLAETLYKLAY